MRPPGDVLRWDAHAAELALFTDLAAVHVYVVPRTWLSTGMFFDTISASSAEAAGGWRSEERGDSR